MNYICALFSSLTLWLLFFSQINCKMKSYFCVHKGQLYVTIAQNLVSARNKLIAQLASLDETGNVLVLREDDVHLLKSFKLHFVL